MNMVRIISYNIRYNNSGDGDNAWPYRKDHVANLLTRHRPDLIGLQEVRKEQLDELIPRLPEFGWVGVGRDDGKEQGEFATIFYRRDEFQLINSGTIWLSETPNVIGSVGWDASMARIASWAEFAPNQSSERFLHVNTHFDHRGTVAQVESARLLRRFLSERTPSLPTIVTGDFNVTPQSLPYQALTDPVGDGPPLQDAMVLAKLPHEGPSKTFNGTFTDPLESKIDYIFVWEHQKEANTQIQVHRHAILAEQNNGHYPSDHLPVMAEVQFS